MRFDAFFAAELLRIAKSHSSCPGLTRASIHLRKSLAKKMDCRVKPGNDGAVLNAA
jgi:hypothetical protein